MYVKLKTITLNIEKTIVEIAKEVKKIIIKKLPLISKALNYE